ncbi:PREDICTED: extracellular tyrosine-protein kinase PKDCC-like [Sturnus vulgaris]|uniref:extracellular tyrosine-protein kinase PKDCC-like n=1 Tax=Sturnus vulgaris TaxID=9172 RepID=UPI00071A95E1|nr:PREDICTED: extracellular tyrosine-protein kinase PKDCC-like [Sturnus vulgaris]
MAAAGRARRGARLSAAALLALPALALLALLAMPPGRGGGAGAGAGGGAGRGGETQPGSSPPLLLPPGLREELRQRRRDLRRLEAVAGGGEAAATGGLGCGDLSRATAVSVLGWGFTKVVARAALAGGGTVALKSVHGAGREVRRCVQRYGAPAGCRRLAAYKLLKEVTLLQRLQHPGIVKLHGQCYDNSGDAELRVTAMLELGSPLEMIQLLQTPWEERFKICLSLVKLLFYLAHSPLGSIVLLDFQPRQFVMVDGNLKVTDMDDASTEELSCKEDNDCTLDFPTKSFPLKCSMVGKCEGINEKKNLFNAYRYFFTYLLPHSAPPALRPLLSDILNATGDLRYGINETLRAFEKVLHLYKSGLYLQKRPLLLKDYISLKGFRTVEGEGYKCWPSYSHLGCLLSIHSAEEAAAICNSQLQCQSFIITQHRTWTGRPLASFQSSWTDLIPDANAVVYIKRSASSGERL